MNALFAYLDPGTGATLMQLMLAGTVGIGALVRLKWESIRSLFRSPPSSSAAHQDEQEQSAETEDEAQPIDFS